jgi:hypothetical protein
MSHQTINTPSSSSSNDSVRGTSQTGSEYNDHLEAETIVSPTEVSFQANDRSLKYLVVLCQGLKDESGGNLLDLKSIPFSSLKRSDVKPNLDMLKDEVARRYQLMNSDAPLLGPRPKNWTKDAVLKWLNENPIQGEEDVAILNDVWNVTVKPLKPLDAQPQKSESRWFTTGLAKCLICG